MNPIKLDLSALLKPARSIVSELWSSVDFASEEQAEFARTQIEEETRGGVRTLAALFVLPMLGVSVFASRLGLEEAYRYGFLVLAGLSVHIFLASRAVREVEALNLLGMVLLVVSGTTFVLIAHRTGALSTVIFASVGLLFMAIPSMPWGLREGSLAAAMIYGLFTGSTWSVADRFAPETLWTLQLYMLAATVISTTLVGRSALVRKRDLTARFELDRARGDLETLSLQDALTGLWNRRYLEQQFKSVSCIDRRREETLEFALVDLDAFKEINDQHGHVFGDRILCLTARALESAVGDDGFVARFGGDEFACVLTGGNGFARLNSAVASLAAGVDGIDTPSSMIPRFSVGLIEVPIGETCDLESVCRSADAALYEAKRKPFPATHLGETESIGSGRADSDGAAR